MAHAGYETEIDGEHYRVLTVKYADGAVVFARSLAESQNSLEGILRSTLWAVALVGSLALELTHAPVAESTISWLFRSTSPLLVVIVTGVGMKFAQGVAAGKAGSVQASIGTALPAIVLICVSVVCPVALFKLLAFVDPGTASGASARTSMSVTSTSWGNHISMVLSLAGRSANRTVRGSPGVTVELFVRKSTVRTAPELDWPSLGPFNTKRQAFACLFVLSRMKAETAGFEPAVPFRAQRFSKPPP